MYETEELTLLGYLKAFERTLLEESNQGEVFAPFLEEIHAALGRENYPEVLHLLDELEEFMDREFC